MCDHIGLQRDKFSCKQVRLSAGGCKSIVDSHIASFRPSKLLKPLSKSREALLHLWIIFGEANQYTDAPHGSGCCARATMGHAIAVPPITPRNSRRFIADAVSIRLSERRQFSTRLQAVAMPLWVKSGSGGTPKSGPLYPSKRTWCAGLARGPADLHATAMSGRTASQGGAEAASVCARHAIHRNG
jgi:hypothetical protein